MSSFCEYIENPRIRTKSQLIESRKKQALELSTFFANNQHTQLTKSTLPTFQYSKSTIFAENPAKASKIIQKQKDLENFSLKFSTIKHGIHSKSIPKFSENLDKITFFKVPKVPSPKVKTLINMKNVEIKEKNLEPWTWLNESSDIVEFNELKRSIKMQQENFRKKGENAYSEYFSKLIKEKEIKERLVYAVRSRQKMLIQNRVSRCFRGDGSFVDKEYLLRTSGFLPKVE